MPKHYVTFGQGQAHHVGGQVFHPNVVARFDADNSEQGRDKAFELFGRKFCFEYHDAEWDEYDMKYYPDGYVDIEL